MMQVRQAQAQDAPQIAGIIRDTFAEDVDTQRLWDLFEQTPRVSLIAVHEGDVVGFVDGFRTVSLEGNSRMELDLMAVATSWKGQGVGSMLVEAFLGQTPADVCMVRALVAVGNRAMQQVCHRFGFQQSACQSLYVQQAKQVPISAFHIIPVYTLTYDGRWLEGDIRRDGHLRAQTEEIFGAVVPSASALPVLLQEANFVYVKDFHWWTKSL